ncbi:A24 family peptidase [Methylobacterium planeticum]|uniref:Peptidase n=1 Tax=Methylobacterium planeticum TaxID=2615211 RepID=A0A6N6MQ36_9HYPH|nr:prepilin peptidase [Methylobacterium planeticum]KAB1070642.1 peptidase [Methylobacterium planeticum]
MAPLGLLIVFPFLMAYAAANDLLTMLIPNRITLALTAGFAALAATGILSPVEIGLHLGAGALVLAITFALFACGIIGGGDAKLAAATALWLGFDHLLDYAVVSAMLGGGLTLALLAARSHPLPFAMARLPFALHLHDRKTGVPYGIALAAGALIVLPDTLLWARALTA